MSKQDLVDNGMNPVYSSNTDNNGVLGFVNKEAPYKITQDVQVYLVFGDHTRSMNIATSDFCVTDNVKVLIPNRQRKHEVQFIATAWRKSIPDLGYARHWSVAKEVTFKLPISDDGSPNYDFMDSFMKKLEVERAIELDAYLSNTGLKDYHLTEQEEDAIKFFGEVKWKEFKIGKLFKKLRTKKLSYKAKELPKEPVDKYVLPCLTSSFMNQGLNYYVPKENATILKNVISIPSNSDVYRAYYQPKDFTILSDAYAVEWVRKDIEIEENHHLFFVQCINKVTDLPIYSYKNKLGGWNVVKDKYIKLPVKEDGTLDYKYMDTLIQAVKKLAIKNLVLWVQEEVQKTIDVK